MIVLGIDPGTAIAGYGVIHSENDSLTMITYGTVTTPSDWSLPRRLLEVYQGISQLLTTYHPEAVAVEELFFGRNVKTALSVGQARGVCLLAGAQANIPVYSYTPLQVKQAVVGYGKATKQQIQQLVRVLLRLDHIPKPDDAADALAIAICHVHSAHLNSLLSRY